MGKRAIILMLDSVGIGSSIDADQYGDQGANTVLHVAEYWAKKHNKPQNIQTYETEFLPHLGALGLFQSMLHAHKDNPQNTKTIAVAHTQHTQDYALNTALNPSLLPPDLGAAFGFAQEISAGKDTPSGHWEMAGCPVLKGWKTYESFDKDCLERLVSGFHNQPKKELDTQPRRADDAAVDAGSDIRFDGFLANKIASGTEVIAEYGTEHIKTGKPIIYTSTDSVMQIAAHEDDRIFGLQKLYALCEHARMIADDYDIGRVIARPFTGATKDTFQRTHNRRDWSQKPTQDLLFNHIEQAGGHVIGIGKISDIYAHTGITTSIKAAGNMDLFDATLRAMDSSAPGKGKEIKSATKTAGNTTEEPCTIMTNFVDFDMVFGHRRNIDGYMQALIDFDQRLPEILNKLCCDDLLLITADHGCDPSWHGTDHTREYVPMLWAGYNIKTCGNIGKANSFSDMGQTIASHLGVKPLLSGEDVL
jgi:phosphopentomutase